MEEDEKRKAEQEQENASEQANEEQIANDGQGQDLDENSMDIDNGAGGNGENSRIKDNIKNKVGETAGRNVAENAAGAASSGATAAGSAGAGATAAGAATTGAATSGAATAGTAAATGAGMALAPVLIPVIVIILILVIVIGIIGFFTSMPQFLWNRLKEQVTTFLTGIQGYFVGMDDALVKGEDILYVGQYLYDMGYDLVGMGFADSVIISGEPMIISDSGISTAQGDQKKLLKEYQGKTGEIYEATSEVPRGQIVALDAPYLRAYLVAENRTYLVNNYTFNWKDYFQNMFNPADWGAGMINLPKSWFDNLSKVGLGGVDQLIRGVSVNRPSNTMTIRKLNIGSDFWNAHYDYTTFSLEGWSGRYGKPFELLVTLHVATMAPDLVEEFANNPDLDAKVNIRFNNADFNGQVLVDGKTIDELASQTTTDEAGNTVSAIDESTLAQLRNLQNKSNDIKTSTPYITSVTKHWFRNVYFEGSNSLNENFRRIGSGVDVGVDEDEDKIEDYNEESGPKTQVTRKISASDNAYGNGSGSETELDYNGTDIQGVGKITIRGNMVGGTSQTKDAVRGKTNETTKKLFGKKYYIYDGTIEKAKAIQKARTIGDDSIKDPVTFTKESLQAFTILEQSDTLDAQFIYRDLKELTIELGYFEREDFEEIEQQVLEWPLPDFQRKGWPDKKYEKQVIDYGTLMLCEESVEKILSKENEIAENESDAMTLQEGDEDDEGSSGGGSSNEGESSSPKQSFSDETQAIVERERGKFYYDSDFYRNNIFMNQEGYDSYVKSLGGVFAKYGGRDNIASVTSAQELQAVSEYVYGLMCIYGFDYDNGKKYKLWGDNNSEVRPYAFYKGTKYAQDGHCAHPVESIDGRCIGESGKYDHTKQATTNCNHSVDAVFFKAGIFSKEDSSKPTSSCSIHDLFGHGAEEVPSIQDLQPGDLIECYNVPVGNQSDHTTWPGNDPWWHVCFIGERDEMAGTLTIYEGGGYFIQSGNYKRVVKIDGSDWPYPHWGGVRVTNLTNDGLVGFPEDIDVIAMGDGIVKEILTDETNKYTLSEISRRIDSTDAESPEVEYAASEQTLQGVAIKLYGQKNEAGDTLLKGYTLIVYGFDVDDNLQVGQKVKAGDVIGKTTKSNLCFILLDRDKAVVEDVENYVILPAEEAQLYPGNNAEEKVWNALIKAGYSPQAASGVMGNIFAESGFKPEIIERGNGIGFGLCQWSYERRTRLEAFARSRHVDASNIDLQIEYLMGELTPGGGCNGYAKYQFGGHEDDRNTWMNSNDPKEAARAFCNGFERPGIPHYEVREEAADKYYNQYGRGAQSTSSTTQ